MCNNFHKEKIIWITFELMVTYNKLNVSNLFTLISYWQNNQIFQFNFSNLFFNSAQSLFLCEKLMFMKSLNNIFLFFKNNLFVKCRCFFNKVYIRLKSYKTLFSSIKQKIIKNNFLKILEKVYLCKNLSIS